MNLIDKIKADQVAYRKVRAAIEATSLTTLIGEAQAVGKKQNREPTDAEVISTCKKFISNLADTAKILETAGSVDSAKLAAINYEIEVLSKYVPSQLSEDEIRAKISELIVERKMEFKEVLQRFKDTDNGRFEAGKVREVYLKLTSN
jgi:uncharacterized protein YqeY